MLVCPLCRMALGPNETVCPRDGRKARRAAPLPVPGSLKKRFKVESAFAHGESGTSYFAEDSETQQRGLLKVLRPANEAQAAERQRLKRELLKQATLEAAHVARPLASGESDGVTWIFREYLEATPLRTQLSGGTPVARDEALSIAAQLVSGLDDLHRAGLLHRDLHPGHVLLRPGANSRLRALLIDAGQCSAYEVSGHGTIIGTPGYVAPEQLQGKLVSFRSDLYALGCVIYEMLTGQPAFAGDTVQATLTAQLAGELPKMPEDLPTGVGALLKSLLAKDPQERPFSAQKLRRTLDPYLPDGAHVTRQPPQNLGSTPDPRRSLAPRPIASLRPPAPPPASGSRIPPPPSVPPARLSVPPPPARPSVPPPPADRASQRPAPTSADSTQQLDVAQIVEMAPTLRGRPSVAPPAARAPSTPERTQALDFDQLLEVVPGPTPRALTEPPPPPERMSTPAPAPRKADMTQPIRLDQILAVADTRHKGLDQKGKLGSMPTKGLARGDDIDIDVEPAKPSVESKNLHVVPAAGSRPSTSALDTDALVRAIAEDDEDDAVTLDGHAEVRAGEFHDDLPPARPSAVRPSLPEPSLGLPAVLHPPAEPPPEAAPSAREAPRSPVAAHPAAKTGEPLPSIIVESSPPPPMRPSASETVQMPAAAALDTPTSVKVGDSGQLTLPREPVSAAEATRRLGYEDSAVHAAPSAQRQARIAYAVAAAALLALAIVSINALSGDGPAPAAQAAAVATAPEAAPKPAIAAAPAPEKPLAPAVAPLAETPKGEAAPAPSVEPAAVEPQVEPKPEPKVEPRATSEGEGRARKASEHPRSEERVGRARESKESEQLSAEAKLARWATARDEARAHYAAKRYAQAASSYEEASRFNPSHAGTFAGLGAARLLTGDGRGAIQAYQKAVQLSPTTSGFHAALGKAYVTAGDKAKARTAYRRALALDPKNEAAKQALAELGE